jgi:hypothetical protein
LLDQHRFDERLHAERDEHPASSPAASVAFTISPSVLPVVITSWIAAGVNRGTTGFGTSSEIVPSGGWITLLGTTSPNLAGSLV